MSADTDHLPSRLGYRRREFGRAFGVSESTVERWIAAGHVRTVTIGGTVIVPADEARRLMTEGAPNAKGDPKTD